MNLFVDLLTTDVTEGAPPQEELLIYVAVADDGSGYILGWDGGGGRLRPSNPESLTYADLFEGEVSDIGRHTEEHLFGHPETPGVYRFRGTMRVVDVSTWEYPGTEFEPAYYGEWTLLYEVPLEVAQ